MAKVREKGCSVNQRTKEADRASFDLEPEACRMRNRSANRSARREPTFKLGHYPPPSGGGRPLIDVVEWAA
jgi:hypothetical protein